MTPSSSTPTSSRTPSCSPLSGTAGTSALPSISGSQTIMPSLSPSPTPSLDSATSFAPSATRKSPTTASSASSAVESHSLSGALPRSLSQMPSSSLASTSPPLIGPTFYSTVTATVATTLNPDATPSNSWISSWYSAGYTRAPEPSEAVLFTSPGPDQRSYPMISDITVPIGISEEVNPTMFLTASPSLEMRYPDVTPTGDVPTLLELPSLSWEPNAQFDGARPSQWLYTDGTASPETEAVSLKPSVASNELGRSNEPGQDLEVFSTVEGSRLPELTVPPDLMTLFDSLYALFHIPSGMPKEIFRASPEPSLFPTFSQIV
ncbi:DNA mismatch repair protein [Gracilaria domingensis]|nr:DNA mismatch repair protein [Gracilaria domingensis]